VEYGANIPWGDESTGRLLALLLLRSTHAHDDGHAAAYGSFRRAFSAIAGEETVTHTTCHANGDDIYMLLLAMCMECSCRPWRMCIYNMYMYIKYVYIYVCALRHLNVREYLFLHVQHRMLGCVSYHICMRGWCLVFVVCADIFRLYIAFFRWPHACRLLHRSSRDLQPHRRALGHRRPGFRSKCDY
jgi:hypothetical protein